MQITNLINKGIIEGVFPGAAAAWGYLDQKPQIACAGNLGSSRCNHEQVTPHTVYDLASLTKILSTTFLIMELVSNNKLDPNAPLSELPLAGQIKSLFWKNFTTASLLTHQSGLNAWQPFYLQLAHIPKKIRTPYLIKKIVESPLPLKNKRKTIYSDLGFILLGFLVESFYEKDLNLIFKKKLSSFLKLDNEIGYCPLNWNIHLKTIAPTEDACRIGGPLDYPKLPLLPEVPIGIVHDDNARWLGGISGHAGLFGTINGVWELLKNILEPSSNFIKNEIRKSFIDYKYSSKKINPRPWGFDMKKANSSLTNSEWSDKSIGHHGYTGTSFWYDPNNNFMAILLSNRVHPSAKNSNINFFRPIFFRTVTFNK